MQLLQIDSSILGPNSVSRRLTADIVAAERRLHPDLNVIYRDLAAAPLQHLTGSHLAAAAAPDAPQPEPLQPDLAHGKAALTEFLGADIVVIGAPMYNFAISSQLKAWIDRITVAGVTFQYTKDGPRGLVGGKKILIASSRGGIYAPQSPRAPLDHQETYLRTLFSFLGVTDITFIRAEGLAMTDHREAGIAAAETQIAALV